MKTLGLELDTLARSLAKEYLKTESKLLELLIQMKNEKVFVELNYTGIFDYGKIPNPKQKSSYPSKNQASKTQRSPKPMPVPKLGWQKMPSETVARVTSLKARKMHPFRVLVKRFKQPRKLTRFWNLLAV